MTEQKTKSGWISKSIKLSIISGFVATFAWIQYASIVPDVKTNKEVLISQNVQDSGGVIGVNYTATTMFLVDTLLNKNGGYTSNSPMALMGVFDNMPKWELGVLYMARDSADILRTSLSRSRSQSLENNALKKGVPLLNYNNRSYWLPSSESQYNQAYNEMGKYLNAIIDPSDQSAQFYARADNLAEWLTKVSGRLGNYSQMLSASVGQERINTDLANDSAAQQSTFVNAENSVKTDWMLTDDVFWEVRGATWSLIHLMKAAEKDFGEILDKKNARVSMLQIIRELESTQREVLSPMVLNGTGFGLTANYSLVLANYVSRVNASINDMIIMLNRG